MTDVLAGAFFGGAAFADAFLTAGFFAAVFFAGAFLAAGCFGVVGYLIGYTRDASMD